MPKVKNTRKQRAEQLVELLQKGPAFLEEKERAAGSGDEPHDLKWRYVLWVNTWVMPELRDLVPELKLPPPELKAPSGKSHD